VDVFHGDASGLQVARAEDDAVEVHAESLPKRVGLGGVVAAQRGVAAAGEDDLRAGLLRREHEVGRYLAVYLDRFPLWEAARVGKELESG
jgi:hypothetical protein